MMLMIMIMMMMLMMMMMMMMVMMIVRPIRDDRCETVLEVRTRIFRCVL